MIHTIIGKTIDEAINVLNNFKNKTEIEKEAKELVSLLKGINCYVNLIPYNETENIGFKRTKKWKILQFYDILKSNNINVTIRKEFGGNVDAACGQLRAKAKEE